MGYDIKTIKQEFKDKGIFYTPPELAEMLKSYVDVEPREVYDPTCGRGNLLSVFGDDIPKYGQDINTDEVVEATESLKNFVGMVGDTLKNPQWMGWKFHVIVANPPFSIKWEPVEDERFTVAPAIPTAGKADYAFLLHILHYLADDGVAVVLGFPGILYRGNREGQIRQWMVESNYIDKVIHVAGNTFVDTTIATCILVLRKNKTTTDIEFVDSENGLSRVVSVEEIKQNGFGLSVNNYVTAEEISEVVDPIELEKTARQGFLIKLRQELEFSKMVCEMEGIEFDTFIKDIKDVIKEYEAYI